MDKTQILRDFHGAFGYYFSGDKTPLGERLDTKVVISLNSIKVAMYIPVINFIVIGIMASIVQGDLLKNTTGRFLVTRMVISAIAAPILLPIDIIATVAIRLLLKKAEKAAAA